MTCLRKASALSWFIKHLSLLQSINHLQAKNLRLLSYCLPLLGIPAVIVGLVAAIRPSTFDMSEVETTNVTCGYLKLTPQIERNRYAILPLF